MKIKTQLQLLCSLLLLLAAMQQGFAQSRPIKGMVYDENNNPVAGATVTVKNSKTATSTDASGAFSLTLQPEQRFIIVSFVGYDSQEITVGDAASLNIVLHPSASTLENVVVTALGFEAKRDKLGYATSKVSAEQLSNSGEAGLADALGGKASGVRISRTSGDPGAASQILIRGQSTITRGTDPLIILDGVPINGSSRGEGSGGTTQQARINDINPDDIASVQVLKGASAAALWGTKAANGVIIITTKKGTAGDAKISYKSSYSIDEVSAIYDRQTTYGQGTNGSWKANNLRSWGDRIADRPGGEDEVNTNGASFVAQNGKVYYPIISKNSKQIFTDQNYNDVISKGHYFDNSLSVSGGDSKSTYFFSLSDLNQKGIFRSGSNYRRTTVRLNASRKLNDWLTVSNKASYALINSDRQQTGVNNAGFMIGLMRTPPDFDNSGYIGKYAATAGGGFIDKRQRSYRNYLGASINPGFNNPLWDIYELDNTSHVNRFINSAELNAKPIDWLTLTARAGIDYFTDRRINYWPYNSTNANTGTYSRDEFAEMQFNLDVFARAEKRFSDQFSGNLLVGFNYNALNSGTLGASSQNFVISDGPRDLDNATPANIGTNDGFYQSRSNAGYTSIGAELFDQLYLNATGRLEAASTFGALSNKTFFYPSADIAWQFSRLPALSRSEVLSFGKIRASYGVVGIQPTAYQTSTNFVVRTWDDGWGGSLDPSLYGEGSYIQSVNKGNPYLKPEQKKEFEIGTDLRFVDNKLAFSLTYYQNKTVDALISIAQAASTGFNSVYTNAGSIQNKGVELDLSYDFIREKDWGLTASLNWTRNRNEVLDLKGVGSISLGGTSGISSRAVEGYPLGVLYSIPWLRDSKGDLQLNANGFPIADVTSKPIGDPNPDWRGGFSISLRYKNFSLSALVEHSQGGVVANGTEAVMIDYGTAAVTGHESTASSDLKNYKGQTITAGTLFRGNIYNFGAGDVALDQSWYNGLGGWFGNVGEQFLEDASWTRFRELNLAYNLQSQKLKRLTGLQSVVFELSGRNLFLFSHVKGYDPDSNVAGSTSARGVVYFVNPPTRSYLFTLKLNF